MREDRRPSLWKSLMRALGGAPIESPAQESAYVPRSEPAAGVPQAPPARALPDVNDVPPFLAEAEPAAEPQFSPPPMESATLPEPPMPAEAAPSAPQEPGIAAPQPARLARGLASFSRRNPEREKKFAHLLHDNPPDEKKGSPPPGRRG